MPATCSLPCRLGLSLLLGLLLRHGATGDLDYLFLDGGDGAIHTGPDTDGEAFVDGLADLLLEGDLVPLGDERGSGLEEPASERDAHSADLAHERGDTFGTPGIDVRVLLGSDPLGDDEEAVCGAPDVGVTLAERLDSHLVQVRPAVDNGEVAGLGLDVHAREFQKLRGGRP